MDKKYYVCLGEIGISVFDVENGSMTSIVASKDKSSWIKFSIEEAEEAKRHTQWDIARCEIS